MRALKLSAAVSAGFVIFLFIWAKAGNLWDGYRDHASKEAVSALDEREFTIEHKFAIVNAGTMIQRADPSVDRAHELLARASEEYGIDVTEAADMSVAAAKLGKSEGVQISPMEVLEATALAYINDAQITFAQVAAMYVEVRIGGQPHAEAMMGLKGILRALTPPNDPSH